MKTLVANFWPNKNKYESLKKIISQGFPQEFKSNKIKRFDKNISKLLFLFQQTPKLAFLFNQISNKMVANVNMLAFFIQPNL